MAENNKSKKELFLEAQNEQVKTLAGHRVTVLKALDELDSFNGEDDYNVGLPVIVNAYPNGIEQARVRVVLPDAVKLAKTVKALNKVEIEVVEISARNVLFKPLNKPAEQPPRQEVVEVDTNPTGNPEWETVPASESAPRKQTPKPAKAEAEEQTSSWSRR